MSVLGKVTRNFARISVRSSSLRCAAVRTYASEGDRNDKPPEKQPGWLTRLLSSQGKIQTGHESHSRMLSDKDTIYELQVHAVQPPCMEEYLNIFNKFVVMVQEKKTGAELVGSWTVDIGDQDKAIHLWKYPGGYPTLDQAREIERSHKEFLDFRQRRNQMLRYRKNQILLAFSFWGPIEPREPKWTYELRSYTLKPGTMIEWGNNWAKGVRFRQADQEAVAGLFSQIGPVPVVHHLWAYKSMQSRKEVREAAWARPGWDECVGNTVPLLRHMQTNILIPTPFSPLQ